MKTQTKALDLSETQARKLGRVLTHKCGSPEGGSPACFMGRTEWQWTWRYRIDDGSALARLGFGETRKMVTLSETEHREKTSFRAWVWLPAT